jgi:hypothetical protein
MLKLKRTWILLTLLLTLGVGVYFEPSHCVRGWLFGEAFFEGRPTSYWRTVVVRDLHIDPHIFFASPQAPAPPPNWWQRCKDWIGYEPRVDSSLQLLDDAATPVLRELTEDQTPQVAGFAQDAIDRDAPVGPAAAVIAWGDRHHIYWMALVRMHNMNPPPEP